MRTDTRPERDEYFLQIAQLAARRSTCLRRAVGCVLVDRFGHIVGTGYNGVPRQRPHCINDPCPGATSSSGEKLDLCEAVHAEINALLQCRDVEQIETIFVTCSPCVQCCKALMNTGATRLVFAEEYSGWAEGLSTLWESAGKEWKVHALCES